MIRGKNVHNHSIISQKKYKKWPQLREGDGALTIFKVGAWKVYPRLGFMRRGREVRKLQPKVMEFLMLLIERPGQVIGRRSIEDALWPASPVTPECLNNLVMKLRRAFADDSRDPDYIETLPRIGLRLLAPVKMTPQNLNNSVRPMRVKSFAVAVAGAGLLVVISTHFWLASPDPLEAPRLHMASEDDQFLLHKSGEADKYLMMEEAGFKKNPEEEKSGKTLHVFRSNHE